MSLPLRTITVSIVIVMILLASCEARRKRFPKTESAIDAKSGHTRQSALSKRLELRETNPPNFFRILVMRLIYGFAAQMELEDRVSDWFNGAFVPPNADDGFGFGGFGDF